MYERVYYLHLNPYYLYYWLVLQYYVERIVSSIL